MTTTRDNCVARVSLHSWESYLLPILGITECALRNLRTTKRPCTIVFAFNLRVLIVNRLTLVK